MGPARNISRDDYPGEWKSKIAPVLAVFDNAGGSVAGVEVER
jgi:hypothetical protein